MIHQKPFFSFFDSQQCQLYVNCQPYHPRVLHRSPHSHMEHWHEHQIAGARIFGISPPSHESTENLRLRLRGLIKHSLQSYMHHNQTSHEARPHHIVTHPCTKAEFVTLFRGLPLFFHFGHYTLDIGGRPALDALNLVLGHGWDTQEEKGTHKTCFVATTVNEMEYFVRIACLVKDLISIERSEDYSPEFTTTTLDQTHLSISYHIHSFVFVRPVKEQ